MKFNKTRINYICSKCGHIEIEKEFPRHTFGTILKTLIIILAIIGAFDIYNIIKINSNFRFGSSSDMVEYFTLGNTWSILLTEKSHFLSKGTYNYVKNYIRGYITDCTNESCKAHNLYMFIMLNFEYDEKNAIDSMFDLNHLLKNKIADCDVRAYLYSSMLNTLDIANMIQCNENHCWNLVKADGNVILVDTTNGKYETLEEG